MYIVWAGIFLVFLPQIVEPYWSLVSDKPMLEVLARGLRHDLSGSMDVADVTRSALWLVGGLLVALWAKQVTEARSVSPEVPMIPTAGVVTRARSRIAPLTKLMSEGILWQGNENGAEAYCPDHEVPLLVRLNEGGRIKSPSVHDPITDRNSLVSDAYPPGRLFCSQDEGHSMLFADSATYGEAQTRALVLIRAKLRRDLEERSEAK